MWPYLGGPLTGGAGLLLWLVAASVLGQQVKLDQRLEPAEATALAGRDGIEVQPIARDEEIEQRLERILETTGWFRRPAVRVDEGAECQERRTGDAHCREWVGRLVQNTRHVGAVVKRIEVEIPAPPGCPSRARACCSNASWQAAEPPASIHFA